MSSLDTQSVQTLVARAAAGADLNPSLVLAVAAAESGFNQNALSPKGAIGIMQLMPATARALGVNPYDVVDNIRGGITYLGQQLARFGDVAAALAAYNWGPEAVAAAMANYGAEWLGHAPAETQNYVHRILGSVADAAPVSVTPSELPPSGIRAAFSDLTLAFDAPANGAPPPANAALILAALGLALSILLATT